MAQKEYVSVFKVDTAGSVQTLGELKAQVKELKKSLDGAKVGSEEYQDTLVKLKTSQNALRDAMYASSSTMGDVEKSANGVSESYNSLVHRMADLKQEWRASTDAVKRADLGAEITKINDKLKEMDASTGNFQRNVGDYKNQMVGAFQATAGAAGGVINPLNNVKSGFVAISTTPVVAILGLVANVLLTIINNLKSSEETMNRTSRAMSAFSVISNGLTHVMQWLGKGIAAVAEGLGWLFEKIGLVSEEDEKYQKTAEREIELRKQNRAFIVEEAKAERDIAALKEKATQKLNYSNEQRAKFLKEAMDKELKLAEERKRLAREEFSILQEKASWADNSAEENDELAQKEADLIRLDTDYLNLKKELNAQYVEAVNAMNAENAALAKQNEEKRKRNELEGVDIERDEETGLGAMAQAKIDEMQIVADMEVDIVAKKNEILDFLGEEQAKRDKEREEERRAGMKASFQAVKNLGNGIADMLASDEKTAKKHAGLIKAIRITDSIIDTVQGAVGAWRAAQSLPTPANMIVGAANAATITAMGIANVNRIKNTKVGEAGASISAPAGSTVTVTPPQIETGFAQVRNITGASEEERLNEIAKPQKVYILSSDIEANGKRVQVQDSETSF